MKSFISIRIVNIDHYLTEPGPCDSHYCPFSDLPMKKVPVIRIFGSTPGGQKACLHIHQIYPYLYVPYPWTMTDDQQQLQQNIYQFGMSLNKAIGLSYEQQQRGINTDQHIAAVVLVKGVPFYGYHVRHNTFLKIYYINPSERQRIAEILQNSIVMNTFYQPYESHVSFELQFLMDYNLFGMDWIRLFAQQDSSDTQFSDDAWMAFGTRFRQPLMDQSKSLYNSSSSSSNSTTSPSAQHQIIYTATTVPPYLQWHGMDRTSYCELEIDTTVMMIANRLEIEERDMHADMDSEIRKTSTVETEADDKLVKSLAGIWKDEQQRRKQRNTPTPPKPLQKEAERLASKPWSTEERTRAMLEKMLQQPCQPDDDKDDSTYPAIMTTFQSVEALYPNGYSEFLQQVQQQELRAQPISLENKNDNAASTEWATKFDLPKTTNSPPRASTRMNSSYYNTIMATPSRFRSLTKLVLPTVDEEVMESLRQSQSFIDNPEDNAKEQQQQPSDKDDMEQDGDDPFDDSVTDAELMQLMEQADPSKPAVTIGYDSTDEGGFDHFPVRPRKLDFGAVVSTPDRRPAPIDMESLENIQPLTISSLPPSVIARHNKRKRKTIPQNDGVFDESDDEDKENDRNNRKRPNLSVDQRTFSSRRYDTSRQSSSVPPNHKEVTAMTSAATTKLSRQVSSTSTDSSSDGYFTKKLNGMWSPQADDERRYKASNTFWIDPVSPEQQQQQQQQQRKSGDSVQPLQQPKPFVVTGSIHQQQHPYYYVFAKPPPPPPLDDPKTVYQEPYYSKVEDVPSVPKVFSGKEFKVVSKSIDHLKPFDPSPLGGCIPLSQQKEFWRLAPTSVRVWTPAAPPPTKKTVLDWMKESTQNPLPRPTKSHHTQISCSTAKNTFDFKYSPTKPKSKVTRIRTYLDLFSLEIHVNTTDTMDPDPAKDEVQLIFWCLKTEDENILKNSGIDDSYHIGILALKKFDISKIGITGIDITEVPGEEDLLWALVEKVRHYDPDILAGYELHNSSWGYLIERALVYDIHLIDELSRVYCESQRIITDPWGYRKASVFRIIGRHMLNVWRLMRSEVNVTSYRFENIVYNILHYRVPHYSYKTLTAWYEIGPAVLKNRLFRYYLERVQLNLELLDIAEVINNTSESARVFGIDFYSVITRGSQFKVESIMFRIAKPENFVMISPSRKQVAQQSAIECLPLVMEPVSQFYSSPLLVMDFQSLYPSIMIAYNYCYSTCVGKIGTPKKLGVTELELDQGLLDTVKDHLNISPNGVGFVKPNIRKGLLAKMLSELLETRVMVKTSMKEYNDDSGLLRLLNARQMTLKYVSNVTYGYTSASFSGRMPCVEIADSIVQTGRETLERTIKLINEHATWGAKVVYGDTDSVFVSLPGKSREEAFDIGDDIAATVTKMNPAPMKLQFEKVYHPCLLISKKRYVGNKYEHRGQKEPVFDAKGIETVRRDGTAATQKIMEYCIKILFRTQDMSRVKEYLYEQWTKILSNRVSIQDFIIAKEVRMGTYRSLPHGAQVALAQMAKDPRSEPQYGERVPYVVVNQGPNARLKDRVTRPEVLLRDRSLRLDAEYYIRKQIIAPLERVFKLVGVDVKTWYDEMPRLQKAMALSMAQSGEISEKTINRIDQYYHSSHCVICSQLAHHVICDDCLRQKSSTLFTLLARQRQTQRKLETTLLICQNCCKTTAHDFATADPEGALAIGDTGYRDIPCDSSDCPVFYKRIKSCNDVYGSATYEPLINQLEQ